MKLIEINSLARDRLCVVELYSTAPPHSSWELMRVCVSECVCVFVCVCVHACVRACVFIGVCVLSLSAQLFLL